MPISVKVIGAKRVAKGLERLMPVTNKLVNRMLYKIAMKSRAEMIRLIGEAEYHGKFPGRLAKSIKARKVKQGWMVESRGASYAGFVHDGTSPHRIPKTGFARMSWINKSGNRVFARVIERHPGASHKMSRPTYQFMPKGLKVGMSNYKGDIRRVLDDAIKISFA